jgi:hypothetical protein
MFTILDGGIRSKKKISRQFKLSSLNSRVSNSLSLNADPDSAFFLFVDPEPYPGF